MKINDSEVLMKILKGLQAAVGEKSPPVEQAVEEELVIKGFNEVEVSTALDIQEEERRCLQVIMEPYKRDAHDNWYTTDTIQKGYESYERNKDSIPANLFHLVDTESFKVEETFLLPEDTHFSTINETLVKGTWMAWTHYSDDEVWELKKSGEIGGLSPSCLGSVDKNTGEITNLAFTKEDFYKQVEGQANAS